MAHYDLFVIGGGSGGVAAARASAALGAKVGIAEGDSLGGTCVNRGCMPKKWYMYASTCTDEFKAARSFGWKFDQPCFNWNALKENTFKEIKRLNGVYETLLGNSGVTTYNDFAHFMDNNTVVVGGEKITAGKFLIAVGGQPFIPDIAGKEYGTSSDEAFHFTELPRRILIVGGGYIAIEFASIFNNLGVETTLMVRGNDLLNGFDIDISQHVREEIKKKGIEIVPTTNPVSIKKNANKGLTLTCSHDKEWHVDQVMFATGRTPMLKNVGIENTAIHLDAQGRIDVDEWQKTSVDHIYAVGDVTNKNYNLTPVAINEARAFADTNFGSQKRNISDFTVPTAVFSQPQIGTVGLTEEKACKEYGDIDIYMTSFSPTKYGLCKEKSEKILIKLIVDAQSDKVVGAHMVGPDAGEIIQILGVALRAGATKYEFDRTVGVHPTLSEEFVTMREMTRKGCL